MMFAEYFKSEINSLHSFLLEQFHKNKKLDFGNNNNNNKIKNMLRTKPGPSTEPTEHKNRSFFFLTFCCIITLISGIVDHYCIMENFNKNRKQ